MNPELCCWSSLGTEFHCHLRPGHKGTHDFTDLDQFSQADFEWENRRLAWFGSHAEIVERAKVGDPAAYAEVEAAGYFMASSRTNQAGIRKFYSSSNLPETWRPIAEFLSEPGLPIDPKLWRKAN